MAKQKFNWNAAAENTPAPAKQETSTTATVDKQPQTKTHKYELKTIPLHKIVTNKDNDYPQTDIDSLAESILNIGLLHNLVVLYDMDSDTYILESGERRFRAISQLVDKYNDWNGSETDDGFVLFNQNVKAFIDGVPCNIKRNNDNTDEGKLLSQIRLISANEEIRKLSPEEKAKKVTELANLYSQLNSLTGKRSNVNKEVANTLGISERQVAKYKAVGTLVPELQALFKNSSINLNEASGYANLSDEEQMMIVELFKSGTKATADEVRKIKAELEEKEKALSSANSDRDNAVKELSSVQKSLKDVEDVKASYEHQLNALQKELDTAKEKASSSENTKEKEALNKKISDLEGEIEDIITSSSEKDAEIESLIQQLEQYKNNPPEPVKVEVPVEIASTKILAKVRYEECEKALIASIQNYIEACENPELETSATPKLIEILGELNNCKILK